MLKKTFLILLLFAFCSCDAEEAKEAGKLTKKGREEVQEKIVPLKNYFKDLWENFSEGYNEYDQDKEQ